MIDAYLHDEVDYFYVAYDVVKPTDVDLFDSSSILSNRYFVSPFIRAQFSEVVWIRSKLGRGLVQSAAILCEYLTENAGNQNWKLSSVAATTYTQAQ